MKMLWLSGVTGVIDTGCQSAVGGRSFHGQQQSWRGGVGRTVFHFNESAEHSGARWRYQVMCARKYFQEILLK